MNNKIGKCLLGRCSLPYEVKDVFVSEELSIYEITVTYRSNYGQKHQKTSFCLSYDHQQQFCLQITPSSTTEDLPLYLVQKRKQQTFWNVNGKDYRLVKPNKHFLKQFNSNIFFKKGVMQINLFFTSLAQPTKRAKHVQLFAYPSIIEQQEWLVIEIDGISAQLGIKEGQIDEARYQTN